jgi:polyisoprenoid-binding protein YceI
LLDEFGQNLESLSLDFEIGSIWTEFDNLTRHLMTADFFDREQFPTAQFRSTKIVPNGDQQCTVQGTLTMINTTGELSFPISFQLSETGLECHSEFTFDRTQFGMTKMTEGVEPLVTVRFHVGKPDRHAR